MKILPYPSLIVGLCLFAPVALAQNELQEIVVIANRLQQPANAVMAAVTVIDKDSIRRSLAQNLAELSGVNYLGRFRVNYPGRSVACSYLNQLWPAGVLSGNFHLPAL